MPPGNSQELRSRLEALRDRLRTKPALSRAQILDAFSTICQGQPEGLWPSPPHLVTATLDDGWGHGLEVIEACAKAAGVRITALGLLQPAERIIETCRQFQPDLLGLTVLQFDSEDALSQIAAQLPPQTRLVCGGPPFQIDEELAQRTGVTFVARSVADFLAYLLALPA